MCVRMYKAWIYASSFMLFAYQLWIFETIVYICLSHLACHISHQRRRYDVSVHVVFWNCRVFNFSSSTIFTTILTFNWYESVNKCKTLYFWLTTRTKTDAHDYNRAHIRITAFVSLYRYWMIVLLWNVTRLHVLVFRVASVLYSPRWDTQIYSQNTSE